MNSRIQIIVSLLLISVWGKAQLPNNSFELWSTTNPYPTPANWSNLNPITHNSGIYTCNQGGPGYSGSYYLHLVSKTIPGKGVVPGVAVCGEIDTITYKAKSGFPFSNRPQKLNYFMQFMPFDQSDSSSVKILLTRWNQTQLKRDTIAYGASYFNSMAHTWISNDTYLNYFSGNSPDSAIIVISSSANVPKEGSYIYIDELQFNGNVIGVDESNFNSNRISISPNPVSETLTVSIDSNDEFPLEFTVFDSLGRLIIKKTLSCQTTLINTSSWSKGIYTVQLKSKKNTFIKN